MARLRTGDRLSLRTASGAIREVEVLDVRPFPYHGSAPGISQRVVVDLGEGQSAEGIQIGGQRVTFLDPRFSHAG